jgi:hypothetical protein
MPAFYTLNQTSRRNADRVLCDTMSHVERSETSRETTANLAARGFLPEVPAGTIAADHAGHSDRYSSAI